jgi:RNase P subunit RPR2
MVLEIDEQKIKNAILSKHANNVCHGCGGDKFALVPYKLGLSVLVQDGQFHVAGPVYPVVSMSCKKCGLISLFDINTLAGNGNEK